MIPEVLRVGSPACVAQWTMERMIGILTREIRQPSNPFANLSRHAVIRAQINALKAMIPDLELEKPCLPRGSLDVGQGYALVFPRESGASLISHPQHVAAISSYVQNKGIASSAIDENNILLERWERLRLPGGSTVRGMLRESRRADEKVRRARCVRVRFTSYFFFISLT